MNITKKTYNEDTPLYNVRIMRSYVDFIERYYPHIDIDKILNYAGITRLQYNDYGYWYSQRVVNRFHEIIMKETGNENIAYDAGLNLVQSQSHFTQYLMGYTSVESVTRKIADVYAKGSRAAKVEAVKIEDTKYEVNITLLPGVIEHPNQCMNRLGSIKSIFNAVIHQAPRIEHPDCILKGHKSCKYLISWDKENELYLWCRIRNYSALTGIVLSVASFVFLPFQYFLLTFLFLLSVVLGISHYAFQEEKNNLKDSLEEMGKLTDVHWSSYNIRYGVTKMMAEIGQATSVIQDERKIISIINNIMKEELEFGRGAILLADSSSKYLTFVSGYGFSEEAKKSLVGVRFRLDNSDTQGILMKVFHTQKPELVEDLGKIVDTLDPVNLKIAKQLKIESIICVPIVFEGTPLGVLVVDNLQSDRVFVQGDINILLAVASHTAGSIANARSFHKLEESEKKHRTLVETIGDIVYTVDMEGRFTYVSPMADVITGYSESELIGHTFEDVLLPIHREIVRKNFEESLEAESVSNYQVQIISKEGKEIPLEINTTMLSDAQGQPIGRIGVARDITRRVQEEEKRKEFEIKALAQDKLASLGEIATGVAHEVNQPLSYIKIILESTLNDLSNNQLDTTELNEDFQESLRQIGKITNIISHLRTFGRSDVASFNPVSLPEVLENTMILMQERLRIKNISINKQIVDNLPMIYGNSVKLEQIFINLLQNSMDALEEQSKGEIDLVMEQVDDNVIVRFSDNGSGMPPEVLEKIFEPFYTTKEVGQGTGIGLAIVYGIIQEHKGSITCASEEGQGTAFTIKLPAYKEKFPAFTSEFSNA